jgi:hypothetical protein
VSNFACMNPGCPRRAPVSADAPPTCYTCDALMTLAWVPSFDDRQRTDHWSHASVDRSGKITISLSRRSPGAEVIRRACASWEQRVRRALVADELAVRATLYQAKHLGLRSGSYFGDTRPSIWEFRV